MLKYQVRNYRCPLCGNEEKHGTNHTGEIYTGCKRCGHSCLVFADVDENADRPFVEATLRYYRFSFDCYSGHEGNKAPKGQDRDKIADRTYYANEKLGLYDCDDCKAQRAAYLSLHKTLKGYQYKRFHVISSHAQTEALRAHDGESVKLYDPQQFQGQYVSNVGRLHDWFEASFPNKRIKVGYWLDFTTKARLMALVPALDESAFSTHESDLYVLNVQGVSEAIKSGLPTVKASNARLCYSDVQGQDWYGKSFWDLPFANATYWQARGM